MAEDRGVLRQIAWTELFPWLALGQSFRLAIQIRLLVLAALGIVLTLAGWGAVGWVFGEHPLPPHWNEDAGRWHRPATALSMEPVAPQAPSPVSWLAIEAGPLAWPWRVLSSPFRALFAPELTLTGFTFFLLCGLWATLVWSLFGGMITRLVTLQFALGDRSSVPAASRFVRARYGSYVMAPLFPLLGVLLLSLPVVIVSLIGRAGPGGVAALGVIWPLFMIIGVALTIFVVGLMFGWPLMWPTISTEGTDSFDALSRSYSYVYQRPLYYAFLIVVAGLLAAVGAVIVALFADAVLYLTAWAVSWGAGDLPFSPSALAMPSVQEAYPTAVRIIGFWTGLVELLVLAFLYSFFFSASVIIYHLLRHNVDGAEMDEAYVDEEEEKRGLPPVTTDEAGVPMVADSVTPVAASAEGAGDEPS